tara:strand:- start:1431 stop:1721 length:291 start_codon:yes stop_codon:yes gene_type:complete
MASKVKYTPTEAGNVQLGQAGSSLVALAGNTAITPSSGDFVAITCLQDGQLTAVGSESAFASLTAQEIVAGVTIYGRWNSLTSPTTDGGAFIAYIG